MRHWWWCIGILLGFDGVAAADSDFGPWEKYREAQLETETMETNASKTAILRGAAQKSTQLQLANALEKDILPRVEKITVALDPAKGSSELVRRQISSLKNLTETQLRYLRSRIAHLRQSDRKILDELEKNRQIYYAAKTEWQSIAPKAANHPATAIARNEPASSPPSSSPAPIEVDILSNLARSFKILYDKIDSKRSEALKGGVDKATAASLWQNQFIPENQKILDTANSVSPKLFNKETEIFRKSLVAFDLVLKAEVQLYTGERTEAKIADFERKIGDFVKAREELEAAERARIGSFMNKGGNTVGAQATNPPGPTGPSASEKLSVGAKPEDLDNLFAPVGSKPEPVAASHDLTPAPVAKAPSLAAPAKPPVLPLPPSDSAAAKCRGALSRYPQVSPSMMTLCRQANDYSAKVMDTYTAIYRGGLSKRLMEGILEANDTEKSQCAIQIAEKFRGSMTEKYLRETCL